MESFAKGNNKKSNSETSFLTRRTFAACNETKEKEFAFFFTKKLSKSLDELNLTSLRTGKAVSFSKKVQDGLINYKRNKILLYKAGTNENDDRNNLAKRCVVGLLMLNAWRKQKLSNKLILEKMENLNEKLEGFEMQVYLLRQLLNAEKGRVESANENIQALIHKIDECNKDRSDILKKSAEMENNFNDLTKYCSQMEGALRNQANHIITSMQEAENWEKQLEKEREKLKRAEADEMLLKEKIQLQEETLMTKQQEIEQLAETNRDLKNKWAAQVQLWRETMVQVELANEQLKESLTTRNELEKTLESRNEEVERLTSTVTALENKLREEDEKNGLLAKSVMEKTNELCEMERKLNEISGRQFRWNGGFDKMGSICAKIPVACICTIGSLLLPFPSYRI